MGDSGFLDEEEKQFLHDELKAMRRDLKTNLFESMPVSAYDALAQIPWLHDDEEAVVTLAVNNFLRKWLFAFFGFLAICYSRGVS